MYTLESSPAEVIIIIGCELLACVSARLSANNLFKDGSIPTAHAF